jgi:hypothetical protein
MIAGGDRVFSAFRSSRPGELAAPDLRRMIAQHVLSLWSDEQTVAAHRLLHHATGRAIVHLAELDLTPEDRVFAQSVISLRGLYMGTGPAPRDPVSVSTTADDFLAAEIDKWSPIKALNFALLMALPATQNPALVATIRNEGISILEWIAHNKAIGFAKIFIYTNDNNDGSLSMLEALANAGEIRLIKNEVDPHVAPQAKAYEHSLHLLTELRNHKWVAYLDADEFLICNAGPNHSLSEILDRIQIPLDDKVSSISLNWKWFSSKNAYNRSPGLVLERFDTSTPNEHVKSIVRLCDVITMKHLHSPIMFKGSLTLNGAFKQFDRLSVTTPPEYKYGQINHYWSKSFQEFVLKKARGRGTKGVAGEQRDFTNFFDWDVPHAAQIDVPPAVIVDNAKRELSRLLSIDGIAGHLLDIENRCAETLEHFDRQFNMKKIYDARGR